MSKEYNPFICQINKETFDLIMTAFFRQAGYIDHNMTLEFKVLELLDDRVLLEANVDQEFVN